MTTTRPLSPRGAPRPTALVQPSRVTRRFLRPVTLPSRGCGRPRRTTFPRARTGRLGLSSSPRERFVLSSVRGREGRCIPLPPLGRSLPPTSADVSPIPRRVVLEPSSAGVGSATLTPKLDAFDAFGAFGAFDGRDGTQVTNNTKALMALDQLLLERLSANTGNLLDDEELIGEGAGPSRAVIGRRVHAAPETPVPRPPSGPGPAWPSRPSLCRLLGDGDARLVSSPGGLGPRPGAESSLASGIL